MKRARIKISGNETETLSANQVVGKSLVAAKKVALYRLPQEGAKVIYTASANETVGTVYSYVGGNGAPLWWMFYDQNQKAYYVKHDPEAFRLSPLKEQGAVNVKEELEQKEAANSDSWLPSVNAGETIENIKKYAGYALMGVAGIGLLYVAYRIAIPQPRYGVVRIRGLRRKPRKK